MNAEKNTLRRIIKEQKHNNYVLMREQSASIVKRLEADAEFLQAQTILLYYSLPDEVDTHRLLSDYCRQKTLLLPVVDGAELKLRKYTGTLREGAFHIQEPTGDDFCAYEAVELAIVPGRAFDRSGNRLGRGKGYYDRLLPRLTNARKIGLCFPYQVVEHVPTEPQDIPVDKIISL